MFKYCQCPITAGGCVHQNQKQILGGSAYDGPKQPMEEMDLICPGCNAFAEKSPIGTMHKCSNGDNYTMIPAPWNKKRDEDLWTEYAKAALTGFVSTKERGDGIDAEDTACFVKRYASAMLAAHKKRWP